MGDKGNSWLLLHGIRTLHNTVIEKLKFETWQLCNVVKLPGVGWTYTEFRNYILHELMRGKIWKKICRRCIRIKSRRA